MCRSYLAHVSHVARKRPLYNHCNRIYVEPSFHPNALEVYLCLSMICIMRSYRIFKTIDKDYENYSILIAFSIRVFQTLLNQSDSIICHSINLKSETGLCLLGRRTS